MTKTEQEPARSLDEESTGALISRTSRQLPRLTREETRLARGRRARGVRRRAIDNVRTDVAEIRERAHR